MENIDSKENLIRLVNQYKNLVFSVCLKLTGDYFVAEDITQETFILAYTHYESFDGNAEKAWICRIASNKCIDYQRQAARRLTYMPEEELPEERMSTSEDPLQMYLNTETLKKLSDGCANLPKPYDLIAKAYFVDGLTAREIAEKEDKNVKTIQTQIYRAREMLKKTIRKEDLIS